jgi:CPA2 family monovalent cation:H+ antiporter-2
MLLGESPFATQIRSDIGSIRTLFVTIFFTSVGMLADPGWFLANWVIVLLWLVVILAMKALIITIICLFFKMGPQLALASGMTLAQVGEFSLVLAGAAREGNLINGDIFALIVAVTILSLFVAPYMVIYAYPLSDRILNIVLKSMKFSLQRESLPNLNPLIRLELSVSARRASVWPTPCSVRGTTHL